MSQYYYRHEKFEVLYGWDEPLQYKFLVIFDLKDLGRGTPVFSNMDLENPAMSISQIKETLARFSIVCPDDLIGNLNNDESHSRARYRPSLFQIELDKLLNQLN